MKALGQEIARRREALGKRQDWLAELAGCSREAISNLEHGKVAKPRTDMIVPIALALGLHENMLRTRGLDVAADALRMRQGNVVHGDGLQSVAEQLTEGRPLVVRRIGDDLYSVKLAETELDNGIQVDAYAALGGTRRTA